MNITDIFNKFAGKEVPMHEEHLTLTIHGKKCSFVEVDLADPNDPTVQAMEKAAKDHGLSLRLWFPGTAGTADYRTDRVNAYIEKSADGKYRVSNRFSIG